MKQSEYAHVAAFILLGVAIRMLLFEQVGIWRDWGFYAYNSELILEGQTPFIDFLGRSPVFIYGYAAVRSVVGGAIYSLRAYVIAWWVLGGPIVYLVGREIEGHTSGLAALCIYLFSPFALVYGMWVNTMAPAAVAGILAVYAILRRGDWLGYALAGLSIGVGFLSRRSIIVILPAIGLFLAVQYARRYHGEIRTRELGSRVTRFTGALTGFGFSIGVGYLLLSNWRPMIAYRLFETHAINLFITFGRGGWPLLGVNPPPVTAATNDIPILETVCQRCGWWTLRTFAKTFIVTLPIGLGILYYVRDFAETWITDSGTFILGGLLGALGVYGAVSALLNGFYIRTAGVLAALVLGYVIFTKARVSKQTLYSRGMLLLGVVLIGFTAGYLYRNRLLHTYYFMDFWPYLSVVIGVIGVEVWRKLDLTGRQLLAIGCVIGVVAALGGAYPLTQVVMNGDETEWYTHERLEALGDDLDSRTDPGDVVFSGQPGVVAVSHAKLPNDNARIYQVAVNFREYDHGPHISMYRDLINGMESGRIEFVILTTNTELMFRFNDSAERTFEANYCRVNTDGVYERIGATLYEWSDSDCPDRRPVVTNGTA